MHRRQVLRWGLGAAGAVVAGCARAGSASDAPPSAPARDGSPSPDARPTAAPPDTPTAPPSTEPSLEALVVPVLCRAAWGAAPPASGAEPHAIRRVTLHHSAVRLDENSRMPARLRQHQRFHMREKGWPDIAYHYAIDRAGHVYELRAPGVAGDTATDYDPAGHLLVLVEGDFDGQQPTEAQVGTAAHVVAAAVASYGLEGELSAVVSGHRDHASTSCPGDALYAELPRIRSLVAGHLAEERVPTLEPVCGDDAATVVADVEAGRA